MLARKRDSWDVCCFIVGGTAMVLPILFVRQTGRPAYLVVAGSAAMTAKALYGPNSPRTLALRIAEQLSLRSAFCVVTYSPAAAQYMRIDRVRPDVVTSGAEFVDESFCLARVPLEGRPLAIGFVGRLSREKGVLNLIEGMNTLASESPELSLDIVGDGPLRDQVAIAAAQHPLGKRLHLHGWVSHADLPSLYTRMRLLVIPSYTEGLPNVMLEAMACGTPVLATKVGGVPDVIQNGANGFLLEDNSPGSLTQALRMILSMDVKELELVTERARQTIRESYLFSKAVDRYETVFRAGR